MKKTLLLPAAVGLAALTALVPPTTAPVADVGSPLPEVALEGFSQTKAESYDDFHGRAVLIEFFAFW